jgi:hypothetical protein
MVDVNVGQHEIVSHCSERRARHRPVNQVLPQRRLELHQPVQFLRDNFRRLVIEADDHRGQHRDAVLAEFGEDFGHRPALLLGVVRPRAFVADPESVNAHLQNFLDLVLADGLDAGEGEDRRPFCRPCHALAEFHRPLFVQQKILVDDQEHQARIQVVIAFHHVVNVAPGGQQLDVLARKECDVQQKSQPFGQPSPAKILPVPETFQPNTFSQLTISGCL